MLIISNRKEIKLLKSIKAYEKDYKRADRLANLIENENAKRKQQRKTDFLRLASFRV